MNKRVREEEISVRGKKERDLSQSVLSAESDESLGFFSALNEITAVYHGLIVQIYSKDMILSHLYFLFYRSKSYYLSHL